MTKKGFVSFGLILVITTILLVSMTFLSMSLNISNISLHKNKFNSYGYTAKSSHSFVYMKLEGYYHDSFIKASDELKKLYSGYTDEQIIGNIQNISENFKKSIKYNMDVLKIYTIPMDFNNSSFGDCIFSMEKYKSLSEKSLIYILIKSKYGDKDINRAYLKEYYIELPDLTESDINTILQSDTEAVYDEHKKCLKSGREFYGY